MAVHLDEILETIRQRESGGSYGAKAPKSSASGAYQFIDSTWQGLLTRYGVNGPPHARDAPPALQDYVASRYIADILSDHGGDLRAVPAVWYTGRYDPADLDRVPHPEAGNNLSVRAYVDHWLESLSANSAGMRAADDQVLLDLAERPATAGPTALDTFLSSALAQQGDRYVFGHEVDAADADPETFDCSELVQWAAARAGVEITDGSWLQYRSLAQRGTDLSIEEALRTPGALLFTFSGDPTTGDRPSRAHVAISLGDGRVMEARNPRVGVLISDATTHQWTHAATIPDLGTEVSAGWPATEPLPEAPPEFGLDSDGDGLLDEHERFIGTNPFAPDSDLDGFLDSAELADGSDPLESASNVLSLGGGLAPAYVPPLSFAASAVGLTVGDPSTARLPVVELPPVTMPAPAPDPVASPPPAPGPPPVEPPPPTEPLPTPEPAPTPAPPTSAPSPEPEEAGATSEVADELLPVAVTVDADAASVFDELNTAAGTNPDLAAYLDELGVESADQLYRLPGEFSLDDWV